MQRQHHADLTVVQQLHDYSLYDKFSLAVYQHWYVILPDCTLARRSDLANIAHSTEIGNQVFTNDCISDLSQ
jgi:hypothetical protein